MYEDVADRGQHSRDQAGEVPEESPAQKIGEQHTADADKRLGVTDGMIRRTRKPMNPRKPDGIKRDPAGIGISVTGQKPQRRIVVAWLVPPKPGGVVRLKLVVHPAHPKAYKKPQQDHRRDAPSLANRIVQQPAKALLQAYTEDVHRWSTREWSGLSKHC